VSRSYLLGIHTLMYCPRGEDGHQKPCEVWELVLFAECTSQDPSLIPALEVVLPKISTSDAICTLARVLSNSPYTPQHPWLSKSLYCLVKTTRQARSLTSAEINALKGMAAHHLE
jgi:hypothetical protein